MYLIPTIDLQFTFVMALVVSLYRATEVLLGNIIFSNFIDIEVAVKTQFQYGKANLFQD